MPFRCIVAQILEPQGHRANGLQGYTGSGDDVGTDLTAFITDEMRADWEANRAELLAVGQDDGQRFSGRAPVVCAEN
jgi:hypothetical protein